MLRNGWACIRFVAIAVPTSLAFLENVGSVARVQGSSMMPTLCGDRAKRDYIWLDAFSVRNFQVQRGDVVVFSSPTDPNRILIKRVVALEGDIVRSSTYKHPAVKIRQGSMWIEGDNKEMSMDSHTFGQVPRGLIIGKATYVIWPPSRWRKLKYPPDELTAAANLFLSDIDSTAGQLASVSAAECR